MADVPADSDPTPGTVIADAANSAECCALLFTRAFLYKCRKSIEIDIRKKGEFDLDS